MGSKNINVFFTAGCCLIRRESDKEDWKQKGINEEVATKFKEIYIGKYLTSKFSTGWPEH